MALVNKNFFQCGSCKFFAQGEGSSFCDHAKANKDEKEYRYWFLGCQKIIKYQKGMHKTRRN